MSKKTSEIKLNSGVYKHSELEAIYGTKMAVKRAFESGKFEKISRGFYMTSDIPINRAYFEVTKKFYPKSVISKRTLLYHYKLTTNQPQEIDLDVSHDSKLRNSTDLICVHRTNKIFGTVFNDFNAVRLKCYSVERALFEVLYFEKKPGQLTSEVVHNYLSQHKYDPAVIFKIAHKFGNRGQALANLILVMSGNKYRITA